MTTSNLAILIFVVTVSLFVTSMFARRPGANNKALDIVLKFLGITVIVLTIVYFKKRLAGG